jgi:integrase
MLSETAIKKLPARASAYRVADACGIPGFGVQITPAGRKCYELRVSREGRSRYYALGHHPETPLSAAREKARGIRARLDQGLPAIVEAEPVKVSATLGALLEAWLANQASLGRRRLGDTERIIRGNVPAALLDKPANAVSSADLRNALAVVHQRGARVLANRLRAHLHALFQYGLQADHDPRRLADPVLFGIVANPVTAIPRDAGAERVGERVLAWAEIAALWNADEAALTWLARQGIRLLLLTGQRVNEVCQAGWNEFDLNTGVWTLPASRVKNQRDHLLPLTPYIKECLTELRDAYPGAWLFPARNVAGASQPWGNAALGHACQRAAGRLGIPPFSARDLRRTWKTLAGEAGLSLEIRNRIQNHALTDVGSRHYDRHSYLDQKRTALEHWERVLRTRLPGNSGGDSGES